MAKKSTKPVEVEEEILEEESIEVAEVEESTDEEIGEEVEVAGEEIEVADEAPKAKRAPRAPQDTRSIDELKTALAQATEQSEKRKLRALLRTRGHRGGLNQPRKAPVKKNTATPAATTGAAAVKASVGGTPAKAASAPVKPTVVKPAAKK